MILLTCFLKNLHLQQAPPTALTAFIAALATESRGPLQPFEDALLEGRAGLESNTISWNSPLSLR